MALLRFIRGSSVGKNVPLHGDSYILGRGVGCDIPLDSASVSRHHARIFFSKGAYYLEDLKSRNGTLLNSTSVVEPRMLQHRDKIGICDTLLLFCADGHEHDRTGYEDFQAEIQDIEEGSQSSVMQTYDMLHGKTESAGTEEKFRAMVAIGNHLQEAFQLEDVLLRILDSLFDIFPQAERGVIVLQDAETGNLVPCARKQRNTNNDDVRLSRTILQNVIQTKQAILSEDVMNDDRFATSNSISISPIRSMMCVPLLELRDKVLGVLQLDASTTAKQFTTTDLEILASVAGQVAIAVRNAILTRNALEERLRDHEIEVACSVQRGLLPAHRPEVPGYEFYDYYAPARKLGGDYYDYLRLPDGRQVMAVADVSGKGISASLLMANLSAGVKYLLTDCSDLSAVVSKMNAHFSDPRWEGYFVTMVLGALDAEKHEVTLLNAGHVLPVLCHQDGSFTEIDNNGGGMPVGAFPEGTFPTKTVSLAPGDALFFFTDGVGDALNDAGKSFGIPRACACLAETSDSIEAQGSRLVHAIQDFVGLNRRADDICIAGLRRRF